MGGGLGAALAGSDDATSASSVSARTEATRHSDLEAESADGSGGSVEVLTVDQEAAIRAELEAASSVRRTGNLGEMREHIRDARALAEAAGHEGLARSIAVCRSGICLVSQVELQIRRALGVLDEIPVVEEHRANA